MQLRPQVSLLHELVSRHSHRIKCKKVSSNLSVY